MSTQVLCPDSPQLLERLLEACVPAPQPSPCRGSFQGGGQHCSPKGPAPTSHCPLPRSATLHPHLHCSQSPALSMLPASPPAPQAPIPPLSPCALHNHSGLRGQMPETMGSLVQATGAVGRCREPTWGPRKASPKVKCHKERSRQKSRAEGLVEAGGLQAGSKPPG